MSLKNIRNFSIIAHIDHGKSTLADRLLEITGTIEKRKMQEQILDSMELEKERGITIKMKPVRMIYKINHTETANSEQLYILNLIDTPGHIDFSYEVSRALKAVEGAVLLVDATQGVQAQTLTTLRMAKDAGIVVLPVVTKIDSPLAKIPETVKEVTKLLGCPEKDVLLVSGKTGEGVEALLEAVVKRIPPPKEEPASHEGFRGLVFDFQYSTHTGVIVFLRVFNGSVSKKDTMLFSFSNKKFTPIELGIFTPDEKPTEKLSDGEIGYIVTGIKEPGIATVGDTITGFTNPLPPLPGYMSPKPVV